IRSLVPGRRSSDDQHSKRQLPPLKRWASVVFVLYIAVILPLMALQVMIMVRGVPRVLATAWDSGNQQVGVIAQAQAAGDGGTTLLSILHLVALLLPTLAVTVGVVRLGRRAVLGIWRWSAPSPGRRVAGALASLAALAFLAWAWLPARPAPTAA